MPKETIVPQAFADEPKPVIPMTPVQSSQIAAIGYDPLIKTLAVTFKHGAGTEYQYPDIEPKMHADFMAAKSIGVFFGAHIKHLPFRKYAPAATEAKPAAAPSAPTHSPRAPWPFPIAEATHD